METTNKIEEIIAPLQRMLEEDSFPINIGITEEGLVRFVYEGSTLKPTTDELFALKIYMNTIKMIGDGTKE